MFYPNVAAAIKIDDYEGPKGIKKNLFSRLRESNLVKKLFGKILAKSFFLIKPRVGIIGSFFAMKYRTNLIWKSKGKIQSINLPAITISPTKTSHQMRSELTRFNDDFDDLDKFLSLIHI